LPLYPYRCTQCGHRFEKIQKFGDEPEKICPECGGALERPLTAPGLQFKGAGWYVNDYAAKSSAPKDAAPAAGSGEKKASESKMESSSGGAGAGASSTAKAAPAAPAAKTDTTKK
jgi:putative FmdB family regulatory protein